MTKIITSSDLLDDIDQNFKVSAGPGAGKTYWLTQHIKNVLQNSTKLTNNRKIACITHTNYATENILKNLEGTSKLEISNIHSFLYKNIIKPYLIFISEEVGFSISELNGHDDDIFRHYSFLDGFLQNTSQKRLADSHVDVINVLQSLNWYLDQGKFSLRTKYPIKIKQYPLKSESFVEFKRLSWAQGRLHHNDVLYFSLFLIERFPFLIDILAAQYPYVFIDEFQDCDPILVDVFNRLSKGDLVLGVIGDYAQSIYNFNNTGALPQQFIDFNVLNNQRYVIEGNRRSSKEIVDFINYLRVTNNSLDSFYQKDIRGVKISKPILYVGSLPRLLLEVGELEYLKFIVRSNQMRGVVNGLILPEELGKGKKLFESLYKLDSNENRKTLIASYIKALEIVLSDKKIADALVIIEKAYGRLLRDKLKTKGIRIKDISDQMSGEIIGVISSLLECYDYFLEKNLNDFYNVLLVHIKRCSSLLKEVSFAKLTKGKAKDFYESTKYIDISLEVSSIEPKSKAITIHKSKGDEFDDVCLVLDKENDLDFILAPDVINNEEHRVYYVGASRAKNKLSIYVPELSHSNKEKIKKIGLIDIIELNNID